MKDLKGKKAIVTGAAQGLGLAMVEGLCEYGVKVCILDISPKLSEVVKQLREKGHDVEGVYADLSNREEIEVYFNKALDKLNGEINILVNNAGIHKPKPALDLSIEDFQSILDVNVTSVFHLSKLAAQEMSKVDKGKIINIASVLAAQGGFNASAYSTSKGAVAQLTKSLSNEWAKDGINVNAVAPGYYETELNRHILNDEERYNSLVTRVPMGRFGKPEELAGIIQFLSSEKSSFKIGRAHV